MNRKWLLISTVLLLVLVFGAGCSNKDAGGAVPSNTVPPTTASPDAVTPSAEASGSPTPSEDTQKPILDAFQELLKTPGNEKQAIDQIRKDISKLSPENADQMILYFEAYQNNAKMQGTVLSEELIKMIQTTAVEPYNEKVLNDLSNVTNTDLKSALQAVLDKGYKIIVPEGMYEAVINYDVYKDVEKYVSPDIAAYIEIMAKESESRMSEDAAIIIPIDEVFSRTLACEHFITTYPVSVKYDQVNQKYANYIDACFFGQNNTPAFDYTTHKLDQEFLDSYNKAVQSGKSSPLITALGEYMKILKENNNKLTTTVTEYRKSMTDRLKNISS